MSNVMAGHSVKSMNFNGRGYTFHKIPYRNNSATEVTFVVDQTCIACAVVMPTSGGPTPSLGTAGASTPGLLTITLPAAGSSSEGFLTLVCTHGTTIASGA